MHQEFVGFTSDRKAVIIQMIRDQLTELYQFDQQIILAETKTVEDSLLLQRKVLRERQYKKFKSSVRGRKQ